MTTRTGINNEEIKQALTGVSDYPLVYCDGNLYINWGDFVISTPTKETCASMNYVKVKSSNTKKKLDMSIGIKSIHYKCKCHRRCLSNDHCDLGCKMSHSCDFELPKLDNFTKFKIYHGHGFAFKIASPEEYVKYQEVPCRFRRFINEDFDGPNVSYDTDDYLIQKYHDLPVRAFGRSRVIIMNFESFKSKIQLLASDVKFLRSIGKPLTYIMVKITSNPNHTIREHNECGRLAGSLPGVAIDSYQHVTSGN